MSDSNMTFTKGPWRIGKNYGAVVADSPVPEINGSGDVEAYGGHLIAESISSNNRPLIAAAPEMYEALKFIKAWFNKLEDDAEDDDPLKAIRLRVHAPVHAAIDAALTKAGQP